MTSEKIGTAAGLIWQSLRDSGEGGVSLTELKKTEGFTSDEIACAVGWLAREGKVAFSTRGKRCTVTLIEQEMFV